MKTQTLSRSKILMLVFACILCFTLILQPVLSVFATFNSGISSDGKYYADFADAEQAKEAASALSEEMAEEGMVLLKNDGALPVSVKQRISVFGGSQDAVLVTAGATTKQSGERSITDALSEHGFEVNPTLDKFYKSNNNTIGKEVYDFDQVTEQSFDLYKDVALITFSRTSSEGNDASRKTSEKDNGWEHAASAKDSEGNSYKHYLQLTNDEQALVEYVKSQGFDKIFVVINSSLRIELSDLQEDVAINGIVWIGMPGENGIRALPKILDGTVNPSGKTADIWYKDFTADPTWYNFGDNSQVNSGYQYLDTNGNNTGIYGVDYEEGIYVGYRYYETRAYEASQLASSDTFDYDKAVVYPFGYGLSYTTFEYSSMSVTMDNGDKMNGTLQSDLFASSESSPATVKSAVASVTVTNTGKFAGKEVVQLYVTAPYTAGGIEKSHVTLVGFGKTDLLQPGQSQKLKISFNIQDMASYDYNDANSNGNKGYELENGEYVLRVMSSSHGWANDSAADYAENKFTINGTALLKLDDFTDNKVGNLFSEENGMFNSLRTNATEGYKVNADSTATTKTMSRADFVGTFPKAPTTADLTVTNEYIQSNSYWNGYRLADGFMDNAENVADYPWMQDVLAAFASGGRAADWDQTGNYGYLVSDMSGIDPDDTTTVINGGKFDGLTGRQAWDKFISSLSFSDLLAIVGNKDKDVNASAFGWHASAGSDSTTNLSNTHQWAAQPLIASTWNVNLANRQGIIVANMAMFKGVLEWWGPGMQVHRSPFAGRTHEYYAEDAYLAGAIASALTAGVTSRGLGISIKHFGFNDQETGRTANGGTSVWLSEQAIREYYLKPFQMALQEGGATSIMAAYGRIGRVMGMGNYNLLTGLVRKEWGYRGAICTDNYSLIRNYMPNDLEIRGGTNASCTDTPSGRWDAENKTVIIDYVDLAAFDETKTYAVGDKVQRTTREGRNDVTRYYEFVAEHAAGAWNAEEVKEVTKESVQKSYASNAQWYFLRQATTRSLYLIANTTRNQNGLNWAALDYSTVTLDEIQAGADVSIDNLKIDTSVLGTDVVSYSAVGLPEGLTIDPSTGVVSGAATQAGQFDVTVTVLASGWIKKTDSVKLTVKPNLTIAAGEEINQSVTLWKVGDTVSATTQYGKMNCTIDSLDNEISLPDGLEIVDGTLKGKLGKAGFYSVVIKQNAKASAYGGVVSGTASNSTILVIEVTGEGEDVPAQPEIKIVGVETIDGGYKITFSDGKTYEIKNGADGSTPTVEIDSDGYWVVNGVKTQVRAQGQDGQNGQNGQQGPQGPKGEQGEQGASASSSNALAVVAIVVAAVALAATVVVFVVKKRS